MTQTNAKIVCDSISPDGYRLVTYEGVFPRIVLAEVNTHRQLSRNSASSRAIPVERMLARVSEDPYVPTHWGKNQRGMQAEQDVDRQTAGICEGVWREARNAMMGYAQDLLDRGIHKQITNRLLEPFMWHTAVITATEWANFFHLRDHKGAHPDFRDLAAEMHELYRKHDPSPVNYGDWHLPYLAADEAWDFDVKEGVTGRGEWSCRVSIGRCARVSYDRLHEEETAEKAKARCDMMLAAGHLSPFENVARPMTREELKFFRQKKVEWVDNGKEKGWAWIGAEYRIPIALQMGGCPDPMHHAKLEKEGEYTHFLGNVQGWVQYRKMIPHEEDILGEHS